MRPLVKHPLVDRDVGEAAIWYHQRDPDVAVRFIDEIRAAMRAAAADPDHYMVRFEDVRRVRFDRFPHSIFFRFSGNTVYALAVLHGARDVEKLIQGRTPHSG